VFVGEEEENRMAINTLFELGVLFCRGLSNFLFAVAATETSISF
jgi:hypothetical protein